MNFVDLDRHFAPIHRDKDAELDWSLHWGRQYGGWLNWKELLQRRRVALLAEALSGKTEELEHRALLLKQQGLPAFYVRIEDLVDRGFAAALRKEDVTSFETWKQAGTSDAWFFLDSVDEARLNNKSFQTALRVFSNELGSDNLNRSFVIVSCRVSDWKGKSDRQALETELPFVSAAEPSIPQDPDEILLAPMFNRETVTTQKNKQREKCAPSDLLVVQLVPLTDGQKQKMAEAAGIDAQAFLEAISHSGLDAVAERPGDLIDLIGYWTVHSRLGSLLDMTEEGVRRKLSEEDQHRKGLLSPERARDGAQRLAAALVLGKTFALKAPGQEPDPTLSQGAVDPSDVLNDWLPEEVNALLRTGLFAPGTYGRVKFHHRTSQEFLAACWLRSMLEHNCPVSEVKRILFAEPYGVKTAVPSLLAVAAWLAQWVPAVREELIAREPVALIAHGDPKSLPPSARESLLNSYAHLDATGQLDYEYIDYRAAWMFSDQTLAPAIKRAWQANSKPGFRLHLLQFIEEGRVYACASLARLAACNRSQDDYMRVIATRAMIACGDSVGLKKLAQQLLEEPDRLSARLAPRLADLLYPNYIGTAGLLTLIDRSEQAPQFSSDGFGSHLASLHKQAPTRSEQNRLLSGIADLVLGSGTASEPDEIAGKFTELSKGLAELAGAELALRKEGEVDLGTLRLLQATERVSGFHQDADALQALITRIRKDKRLNRQLMWADTAARRTGKTDKSPVRFYQIGPFSGERLWGIDESDLEWLAADARDMQDEDDRRIAFSGVWYVLQGDEVPQWVSRLDALASGDPALGNDLAEFTQPRKPDIYAEKRLKGELKAKQELAKAKQSWVDFRDALKKNPEVLDQTEALSSWGKGLHRLYDLTRWLKKSAANEGEEGAVSPSLLDAAFGPAVAAHYAAGMREAWRRIKPVRPVVTDSNRTIKLTSILALDALNLDSQRIGWAASLNDIDAKTAIRHATMAGTITSAWVDKLTHAKPAIVLPEIVAAVQYEFKSNNRSSDILANAASSDVAGQDTVTKNVFQLLKRTEPADMQTLEYCTRIVARGLGALTKKEVVTLVRKRLELHLGVGDEERTFAYLRVLASADGDGFAELVLSQLVPGPEDSVSDFGVKVQRWLGALFDGHIRHGVALVAFQSMRVESLARFLRLAYRHTRPADDRTPNSDSTVTRRDLAEGARNSILTAVMARRETAAYDALIKMASDPEYSSHAMRFLELAHRKAQADADIDPWTAAEVNAFRRLHVAPAKTGAQLLQLALAVLSDIAASLDNADASSRPLLALADDEEKVQQWLSERLEERSKGRYHRHREPQVAGRNEPDIILASTSGPAEVAIEIKNANKKWTVKQLENAITNQLAGDYLLPVNRRHGILVISLHKHRVWHVEAETWDFDRLISHLTRFAERVTRNRVGSVDVRIVAINAWRLEKAPKRGAANEQRTRR
jgi:hypothetical protein